MEYLPKDYSFVLFTTAGTIFVLEYLSGRVMKARKKYDVKYPALYDHRDTEEASKFNCAQRGHQNCLETLPQTLACLLVGGLQYPIFCSIGGVMWNIGRIGYSIGYEKDAKSRYSYGGVLHHVGRLMLVGSVIKFGVDMLMQ